MAGNWFYRGILLLFIIYRIVPPVTATGQYPDILLITIDTCRADRLGCYGDDLAHTGAIDRLSRRSILFTDAWTDVPLTLPSHTSLLSNSPVTNHGITENGIQIKKSIVTIPENLRHIGYQTAAFISGYPLKSEFGLNRGFDLYDDDLPDHVIGDHPEKTAEHVVKRACDYLKKKASSPLFLWVHLYDPHAPYKPPPIFSALYPGDPYRGEISYTDHWLSRLLYTWLRCMGPDSTIALLADHGEGLGNHYEQTHGIFLYQETVRIPLLIHDTSPPDGMLSDSSVPIYTVFNHTTLSSAAVTVTSKKFKDHILMSRFPFDRFRWSPLAAIRAGRFKYILAPSPELYDLDADPGETTNLVHTHTDLSTRFRKIVFPEAEKLFLMKSEQPHDRTIQQLEALGYAVPSENTGTLPPDLPDPKSGAFLLHSIDVALDAIHVGNHSKAHRIFDTLWSYAPSNPVINNNLGMLALYDHHLKTALAYFEICLESQPENAEIWNNLGVVYRRMNRLSEAEQALRRAVSCRKTFSAAHFNLGLTLFEESRYIEAKVEIHQAVQYDPTLKDTTVYRKVIKLLGEKNHGKPGGMAVTDIQ